MYTIRQRWINAGADVGHRTRRIHTTSLCQWVRRQWLQETRCFSSSSASVYAKTVNLPDSSFTTHFDAALHEPRLSAICSTALYQHQLHSPLLQSSTLSYSSTPAVFCLHDGPPFANGKLHMGHFMNKVLKDICNRFQLLQGKRIIFIPGWDCHGLPIELKALEAADHAKAVKQTDATSATTTTANTLLSALQIRSLARSFAHAAIVDQLSEFQQWGIMADWAHPYLTMEAEYEAEQIGVFAAMMKAGLIYRALKPVYWSPATQTALAEAELEYQDDHLSPSIYVLYPVEMQSLGIGEAGAKNGVEQVYAVIWTTTPWTLPGSLAISYHPEYTYVMAQIGHKRQPNTSSITAQKVSPVQQQEKKAKKDEFNMAGLHIIIGADRVTALQDLLHRDISILHSFPGSALEGVVCQHPFIDRSIPMIAATHVSLDSGTALVHTAPAHGAEDFLACKSNGIDQVLSLVDERGCFTTEAGPGLAGLSVLSFAGNDAIITALRQSTKLLYYTKFQHRYPYDWRSKTPVIQRATEQWFTQLDTLQSDALRALDAVAFVPTHGQQRLSSMLKGRKEWCISRQRVWGVPIPAFYDEQDGTVLMNEETVAYVQERIREHGSDCWWSWEVKDLLPPAYRDNGRHYRKGRDTMDVWFDSGSSWKVVQQYILSRLSQRALFPPLQVSQKQQEHQQQHPFQFDVYLEGSDQHRGWFQSSLLTSVALTGAAPYKTLMTHGFVLDEQLRKMSKSLGNIIEPRAFIHSNKAAQTISPVNTSATTTTASATISKPAKKKGIAAAAASSTTPSLASLALGADFLRLWVASTDFTTDVTIGATSLQKVAEVYRKIRLTARFLLGCLSDFSRKQCVPVSQLSFLDRYIIHQCYLLTQQVTQYYHHYQYSMIYQTLSQFNIHTLSAFYFDVSKDRLYVEEQQGINRRSCQTVLCVLLEMWMKLWAPVIPHTVEDMYQHMQPELKELMKNAVGHKEASLSSDDKTKGLDSAFTQGWVSILTNEYEDHTTAAATSSMPAASISAVPIDEVMSIITSARAVKSYVSSLLEIARQSASKRAAALHMMSQQVSVSGVYSIGSSLEAEVRLLVPGNTLLYTHLQALGEEQLNMILGVSSTRVQPVHSDAAAFAATSLDDPMWMNDNDHYPPGSPDILVYSLIPSVENPDQSSSPLGIVVRKARGVKCPRCWRYTQSTLVDGLCLRCVRVLAGKKVAASTAEGFAS